MPRVCNAPYTGGNYLVPAEFVSLFSYIEVNSL